MRHDIATSIVADHITLVMKFSLAPQRHWVEDLVSGECIHIHITDLNASRGDIALHGYGQATFTGDMRSSTASGHLEISHLDTLIALTRAERQMNLMAALVLARLVSHHTDTANTWNTAWKNDVLTVNGFPLPSLIK